MGSRDETFVSDSWIFMSLTKVSSTSRLPIASLFIHLSCPLPNKQNINPAKRLLYFGCLGTRNLDLLLSSPTSKGSQTMGGFFVSSFGGLWEVGINRKIYRICGLLFFIFLEFSYLRTNLLTAAVYHQTTNKWEGTIGCLGVAARRLDTKVAIFPPPTVF